MYGKTKEQLKSRFKIAIISAIIILIVMIITQFALAGSSGESLTWGEFIGISAIGIPAYIIYMFGLLIDWKTQFLKPFKQVSGMNFILKIFIWLAFYVLDCLLTYVNGIKGMIYIFSSKE